jgi:CRISPR/Cas system-associated exonuclease Cas4 (RecB family)
MNKDPAQILYDEMYEAGMQRARDHKRPVQRFRASEAGKCMRAIWYRLSGYRPSPRDGRSQMYGICGDADHDITRQMLRHHGVEVGGVTFLDDGTVDEGAILVEEFDVETPTGEVIQVAVSCRPDGFIDMPGYDNAVLEIKGTGFWPFNWLQKMFCKDGQAGALERVRTKHPDNLAQTQVTMKLSKREKAYLLYKDRSSGQIGLYNEDTGERAGVYIDFDEEMWEEILQRWAFVRKSLNEGKPPAPEYSDGSQSCGWCDFYYMCHGAETRRQKGLTPVIEYDGPKIDIHLEDREPGSEEDGFYCDIHTCEG